MYVAMDVDEARRVVEALIFASTRPLRAEEIAQVIGFDVEPTIALIHQIKSEYDSTHRGIQVVEVAGGYQMATRPDLAPYIEKIERAPRGQGLSRAALETLAVIAYKQPITRSEIEALRGVRVDAVLATLLERGLIREVGRKETLGRPILYGTTPEFLRYFGMKSLSELPELKTPGRSNTQPQTG